MSGDVKNWNAKVILLKLETTEGVDAGPTALANALKVLDYTPQFMDADAKVRNIEKAFFGADPVAMANFKRGAAFSMEMHGSGTATGIPPWMLIAQIAGFGAPAVGASAVVQSPITNGIKSATHWAYIDDLLVKTLGARAALGFRLEDGEYPLFNVTLLGVPPPALAEQAVPTNPTFTGYVEPVLASSENTTFMLDGYALALRRWEMNSNPQNALRSLIGPADRIKMSDRSWSGTIVGRTPDLTVKDYFAKVRPGTRMAAQAVHGTTAGNIVQIDAPTLQITGNVDITEEDGEAMITLPVTAIPNVGNDEIVFTTK
jgi:hypothetical protein